jgi:CheY-like chemotaxis protein
MTSSTIDQIASSLPVARRFARALEGSARGGDRLVEQALTTVLAESTRDGGGRPEHRLFAAISRAQREEATAPWLQSLRRQMLLLVVLEGLTEAEATAVLGIAPEQGNAMLRDALAEVRAAASADALIIEDEAAIAMQIEALMQQCGHRVVGIAATEEEALAIAGRSPPGLILADINLGLGGDGTSAVSRILERSPVPVIFVTAYPERLLTGSGLEPAFVLRKPFNPDELSVASFQAVSRGGARI